MIDYRDTEGRRRWVTVDGNRQDAEQTLAGIIGGGKRAVDRKLTFKDRAEQWLETEAKARLKRSTFQEYEAVLKNHVLPVFGSRPFHKVERRDVIRFISQKRNEGFSRATIKNMIAPLRAMYYDAIVESTATSNPAVKLGKYYPEDDVQKKPKTKPLNGEEIRHLLEVVRQRMPSYYPMILCAARTGMRLGELVGLTWGQIDFHGRFITVDRNFSRGEITSPKSRKVRTAHVSKQLADTLRALLVQRKAEALKSGSGEVPETMFLRPGGTRIDPSNFRKQFNRALAMAGLRRITFHSLRHSFSSLLIQQGADLNYIKERLGHHSITLTVDTYGHELKDDRTAVDALDDESGSRMVADGREDQAYGA